MGFAISWLALRAEKACALEAMQLVDSGQTEEVPESSICGTDLPDGWYLVWLNRFGHPIITRKNLETLSKIGQAVTCQVEEHVMVSEASFFDLGRLVWRVTHESEKGIYHCEVEGSVPGKFNDILARLRKAQDDDGGEKAEVDYIFDAPVDLAEAICRFRHDLSKFDWGEPVFSRLTALRA